MAHGLVHLAAVAKAHFDLGGVHVHVHAGGVDLDIQRVDGLLVAVQHVFIRGAGGVGEHLVAHKAAVDVAVLVVGPRTGGVGQACAAGDRDRPDAVLHGDRLGDEVLAQHVRQAAGQCVLRVAFAGHKGGAPLLHQLALVPDGKAHIGPRQRVAAHGFNAVRQLGRIGLQELAPGGGGEEQLLHLHRRALAARGGAQLAAAGVQQKGTGLCGRAREQGHLRHRADGRQRLAPKAHGGHGFQVVQVGDFAGGMAAQCHGQLFGRNAQAVVFHRNQAHATGQQPHGDLRGPRVQRVVHQLAHHRGGALYHFASGNLADEFVGQVADRAARAGQGCFGRGDFGGGLGWVHPPDFRRRPHGDLIAG